MIASLDCVGGEADQIESLQSTVSASRLNCWIQCRLKFYFRYVLKLVKPKTSALHFGSVIHLVLQQWSLARWRKLQFGQDRLTEVFEQAWADQAGLDWEGTEPAQKKLAWLALEKYFALTPIQANEMPEAVEVGVEADLSDHSLPTLIGVLDLVRQGSRIVDFKTTSKTPSTELALHQNQVQLDCYSVLYRAGTGRREAGRELHHLVKTKVPQVFISETGPMQDSQETRLYRLIESYGTGLGRRDFVPSPGLQCSGCEFFNECTGHV